MKWKREYSGELSSAATLVASKDLISACGTKTLRVQLNVWSNTAVSRPVNIMRGSLVLGTCLSREGNGHSRKVKGTGRKPGKAAFAERILRAFL